MPAISTDRPRRPVLLLRTLAILPLFAACGGAERATGTDVVLTLVPASADVTTHQVTTAVVRGARLTADTYTGSIGTVVLTAGRTNDSTLAFVVPALSAGSHEIGFTIGEAAAKAVVRVAVTADVADPVAYLADVASLLDARIDEAAQTVAVAEEGAVTVNAAGFALDMAVARAALDSARIAFAALTPAEQQEAVKLVRATLGVVIGGAATNRAPSASVAGVPGPEFCEAPLLLTVEEAEVCSAAAAAELAEAEVSECDAEAAEAASRGFSARNRNFVWQLFNGCHYASLTKFSAETWAAIQWPTMPDVDEVVDEMFDEGRSGSAGAVSAFSSTNVADPIAFLPGDPRVITPAVRFRPMLAGDVGKVPAATRTAQLLASVAEKWKALNTFLGSILGQTPATLDRVTSATSRKLTYPANRLRLGAISPATVRGTAAVIGGRWELTFDTDDRTQPTNFTFDVIYNGGDYGSDTATVAAKIVLDSIAIYEAAVTGLWTVTDFHSKVVNTVELAPDGSTYEAGVSVGGWSIKRGPSPYYYPEDRYYLRLWHLSRGSASREYGDELVIGVLTMPVKEIHSHMDSGRSPHHYVKR